VRRALVPALLVTLVIVAVQLEILSSLRFFGVVIMVVWLWPLVMGLAGYTALSLFVALVGGLLFDTHATTPLGLSVVVGLLLAYVASLLGREGIGDIDSAAIWVTPVLGAIGGAAAPVLFTIGGFFVFNFGLWRGSLLATILVNAAAFLLLARPMTRLAMSVASFGEKTRR